MRKCENLGVVGASGFFFAAAGFEEDDSDYETESGPGFYARPPLPKTYMQQPWSEDDPGFSS